jgi:conserved protein with predicted RNA binding PUA domain
LDPNEKIYHHLKALFNIDILPLGDLQFEYSRKTGRIKNFSIGGSLFATLRTDGGLAITIFGAKKLMQNKGFKENCVKPNSDSLPFVCEGRSLFCKHVEWCGSNVEVGSDVAIIDSHDNVLAVGRALLGANAMKNYRKGVAVKVREGIKSRLK